MSGPAPRRGDALATRAAILVAVAVGFWVLGAIVVAALVVAGIGILTYAPEHALAGILAFVLAGGLAYGSLPRISWKRVEETPPLPPAEHPRLHAFVHELAAKAGARAPASLYVSHDANAFAAERKVGIGLPFLGILSQSELGAVLAHEMGHHVAGDVRLGPWVHRTRRAIARTVSELEGSSFWLHLPFVAYADFFLRTSVRVSRAQELMADAVAARVAGASAAASALRKTAERGAAWTAYFELEVLPVLTKGRRPPLLEGFERYWAAACTAGTPAARALADAMRSARKAHRDDTHPTLEERIAALDDPPPETDVTRPALDLVDDVGALEGRILREMLVDPTKPLAPVAWDAVADEVWLPAWREVVEHHAVAFKNLDPRGVPRALTHWHDLAVATRRGPAILSPQAEERRVTGLVGTWFVVQLADRGFHVSAPPGLDVTADRDGKRLCPFTAVTDFGRTPDAAAWARLCDEHGL